MPGSSVGIVSSPRTPLFQSDTVVLGAGVVDTGAVGLNVNGFRRVVGRVYHTQSGSLKFFFSDDGSTWEATADVTVATTLNVPTDFDQVVNANFLRVTWTNGSGTATTVSHTTVDGVAE